MDATGSNYIKAADLVSAWMKEYHRYLLDGDPNIVHPKAKTALVLGIAKFLDETAPPAIPVMAIGDGPLVVPASEDSSGPPKKMSRPRVKD